MEAVFCFFPAIQMSSTFSDKHSPLFLFEQASIPSSVLFPIPFPTKFFQIVVRTFIQQVGVHTDVAQEEPLDLQCSTKILAICVVEHVSTGLLSSLGASSIFT